jgi:diaminohydroxyphosphoribosylaminopyrimidine deaminase/5-amino-6-(5-phosphoribosylamino)uracil reductase
MLDLAARLGMRAGGYVEPNPMVGAVIVRAGVVLGMGHHRQFGGLHAEREALADCRKRGNDPRGATIYVTLEPCKHFGKQPPCTDALIEAGVARVVYARADPAEVSGGGAEVLRQRGIMCELNEESRLAIAISDPFVKRLKTGLPWVIAKWAQTIDGRIATRTGESKWISGEASRRRVHRLRARVDAILTGIGTVLADDPLLTARGVKVRRVAARVVVDAGARLPLESALVKTVGEAPTIVACTEADSPDATARQSALAARNVRIITIPEVQRPTGERGVDLRALLLHLARDFGVATVMIEAGPRLLGSFFEGDLVDEAVVHVAGMLIGDEQAKSAAAGRVVPRLADARRFTLQRVRPVAGDVELVYRRAKIAVTRQ